MTPRPLAKIVDIRNFGFTVIRMAAKRRGKMVAPLLQRGMAGQDTLTAQQLDTIAPGWAGRTIKDIRLEMVRLYWRGENGKMDWSEVWGRCRILNDIGKLIVAERTLNLADQGKAVVFAGVQLVAPPGQGGE